MQKLKKIMLNFEEKLKEVHSSKKPLKTSPNEAMTYLGVSRRGWRVDETINGLLEKYDLMAEPSFESTWKWGEVEVRPKPKVPAGNQTDDIDDYDPTPRLSLLRAANLIKIKEEGKGVGLVSVNRQTELSEAITIMFRYGFSQLPILSGIRDVEGIVSWKSIGKALALGKLCKTVSDCKEEVIVLDSNEPLFSAVKIILEKEVVLVRQKDKIISGIVTSTDIGEQFISLAEPFLIIEQIENHIRKLLDNKFEIEQLKKSIDSGDKERKIQTLSDLTFGEYVKIIENPDNFLKLKLNIDRVALTRQLDEVRKIRNEVMHFDPEGVSEDDLELLRQTAQFFHEINTILKPQKSKS